MVKLGVRVGFMVENGFVLYYLRVRLQTEAVK